MNEQIDRRIGKKDLVLLGILLAAFLVLFVLVRTLSGQDGAQAVITVDGEVYGTYDLSEDQTVEIVIDGIVTNTLVISGGSADMVSANCPDKLCVHQNPVSRSNQNIVCLPNKVVVTVTGGGSEDGGDDVDVVVK